MDELKVYVSLAASFGTTGMWHVACGVYDVQGKATNLFAKAKKQAKKGRRKFKHRVSMEGQIHKAHKVPAISAAP